MKVLYIVRHAKSSWANPMQADFDRPLNDRGKRDAPRMGKRLKERRIIPDIMLTSPAKRALSTCKRIAETTGYEKAKIKTDQKLYHADETGLLKVVQSIKDKHHSAMLFGHNPGLTDFVNEISQSNLDNIPTCGIVAVVFMVDSWKEIGFGGGKLEFFDFPKSKSD